MNFSMYNNFKGEKRFTLPYYSVLLFALTSLSSTSQTHEDINIDDYNYVIVDNLGHYIELGNCDLDKKVGKWVYFYDNGDIKEVGHYSNDVKTGKWTSYLKTGEIYAKGKYIYGRKHQKWEYINGCTIKYNLGNIIKEKCKELQSVY